MRAADIIITTPEHSTIYAWNTLPKNNPQVWMIDGRSRRRGRPYLPCYVLEIVGGYALVLYANFVPDTEDAIRWEQATLLDAAGYTLADWRKRQEVMEKYSHWHSSEDRAKRDKELDKLKPFPKGWEMKSMPTSYIRVLWAEVERTYQDAIDEAEKHKKEAEAAEEARRAEWDAWVQGVADTGLLEPEEIVYLRTSRFYNGFVSIPKRVVETLVESYKEALEEASA